mgnify:CR=1 FL=1
MPQKYVYDYGLTDKEQVTVETLAGVKTLKLSVENGMVSAVTVDMGVPVTEPKRIPVLAEGDAVIAKPLTVLGKEYEITCVSMGNPHPESYRAIAYNLPSYKDAVTVPHQTP